MSHSARWSDIPSVAAGLGQGGWKGAQRENIWGCELKAAELSQQCAQVGMEPSDILACDDSRAGSRSRRLLFLYTALLGARLSAALSTGLLSAGKTWRSWSLYREGSGAARGLSAALWEWGGSAWRRAAEGRESSWLCSPEGGCGERMSASQVTAIGWEVVVSLEGQVGYWEQFLLPESSDAVAQLPKRWGSHRPWRCPRAVGMWH